MLSGLDWLSLPRGISLHGNRVDWNRSFDMRLKKGDPPERTFHSHLGPRAI